MGKREYQDMKQEDKIVLGTDGRLYDSNFDGDGKLNAYEYAIMDDVVFWTRRNRYYKIFERNNRC